MADYQRRMARRIQSERERLGLSHLELAAKVGTTDRSVRRWEAGASEPQPRHLRALAETFDLQVTDLRPNLEAEEAAVRDQLDRIESKLDLLVSALRLIPTEDGATLEEAVGALEQERPERPRAVRDEEQGPTDAG